MGGPAAGILLHDVPNDGQIGALRTWLGESAEFYTAKQNHDLGQGWEFFLDWPSALCEELPGGRCLGGIQLYGK
jgi:hypothetical protein